VSEQGEAVGPPTGLAPSAVAHQGEFVAGGGRVLRLALGADAMQDTTGVHRQRHPVTREKSSQSQRSCKLASARPGNASLRRPQNLTLLKLGI
jgi:hypothetical protein